jgi:hypothetical protein
MPGQHFLLPAPKHATPPRRPAPAGPPQAFETRGIRPYWRKATCAEVDCDQWREGWTTVVDPNTALGRDQADYIRTQSGRRFTQSTTPHGWIAFEFEARQRCFGSDRHLVQADRPELFIARAGDWRAALSQPRVYERSNQWVDDLHTRTDRLFTARSRAGTAGK